MHRETGIARRVGLLTYGLDRPLTGIGRYTVELAQALAALSDRPEIVLLHAGGSLNSVDLPQVTLPGCQLLPGLMTFGQGVLGAAVRRLKLDVIHDPVGVAPLLLAGVKRVVTVHDVIPLSFPGVSTRLDSLIYRRWLPWMLRHVDQVITGSDFSKTDIIRYMHLPADRLNTVYYGVNGMYHPYHPNVAAVRAKYSLTDPYILYVGSVEERKNLKRVIAAYRQLPDLPHKLVIVGPHKQKHLEHPDDRVIFTGYVAQEDLPVLYSAATVFVYPSLYEGFGLPVLEAMASGTPVITSNVSALPEAAGDAGMQVDPYDVAALAAALCQVLTNPALQAQLRAKGLQWARRFRWEDTARHTLRVYERAVQ